MGRCSLSDSSYPNIVIADTLTVNIVKSCACEDLSENEQDMLADKLSYALLATSGLSGIGEKVWSIPWCALQLKTATSVFIAMSTMRSQTIYGIRNESLAHDRRRERDAHCEYLPRHSSAMGRTVGPQVTRLAFVDTVSKRKNGIKDFLTGVIADSQVRACAV
jgi:hypothetical protein